MSESEKAPGDRDPGDSVPPGVAPASPAPPPTEEDLKVQEKLEELSKRKRP